MILYHGTNVDFDKIELDKCENYKDFGKGFYTTTMPDQAKAMARRKARINGGKPCVISYEVPLDLLSLTGLNVKTFNSASEEWAMFVINNRNREFKDASSPLCNIDLKYDVVYGPVANDTLATIIRRYEKGYLDSKALIKELRYQKPSDQYSFHSKKAFALLKKVGVEWID